MINKVVHELLPFQSVLLKDTEHIDLAMPGGVRSGKTWFGFLWKFARARANIGCKSGWVAPNFTLTKQVGLNGYVEFLDRMGWQEGVHYDVNLSEKIVRHRPFNHDTYFVSTNTRLIAYTWSDMVVDEEGDCDEQAIIDAKARVSDPRAKIRQCLHLGAPQGLNHYYRRFGGPELRTAGEHAQFRYDDHKLVLHFHTYWNRFIDSKYIDELIDNFGGDKQLIDAWVFGKFVPLSTGNCYRFNQLEHVGKYGLIETNRQLYFGWDFNVGMVSWVQGQRHNTIWRFSRESGPSCDTTDDAMDELIKTFPVWEYGNHEILIDGDANGWAGHTRGLMNDYDIIQERLAKEGYRNVHIIAPHYNSAIQARVIATNRMFNKEMLYIDESCKYTIDSLNGTTWDNHGKIMKGSKDVVSHKSDALSYVISRQERIDSRDEQLRQLRQHGRQPRRVVQT